MSARLPMPPANSPTSQAVTRRQISEMPGYWCVVVMAGVDVEEPRPHMRCTRCGERMVSVLPLKLLTYVEAMKGFLRAHTECKP